MGIKIDLITGLAIVVIIGVLLTSRFFPSMEGDKQHVSSYESSAAVYQVAYKQSRLRK